MSTPNKHKTLLKVSPVSSDHWSSGKSSSSSSAHLKQTKCVVQIVKACQLLASDAETGKSDPVCFMKFTPQGSDALSPPVAIDWDSFESPASGILSTAVIQACTDPIWNSYHTFPLILESYQELLNASIDLRIRDEDVEEDGSRTYDDLGQVSIHLKDSIKIAKVAQRHNKNAFLGAPVWHTLEKCPGMRKKDGKILVSISIHFEDDDTKLIQKEIGVGSVTELMSKYKADASGDGDGIPGFSATSGSYTGRRKSSAALTPRVASPVRLFNDSLKTPLLELAIPEESFQKGNGNYVSHDKLRDVTSQPDASSKPIEDVPRANINENENDTAVQSEVFDDMTDMEAKYFDKGEKLQSGNGNDTTRDNEDTEVNKKEKELIASKLKAESDAQAQILLESAVKKAKEEAERESARIIAQAKAEIEIAKEAAKQQLEVENAVIRAKQEVERVTELKVKHMLQEAQDNATTKIVENEQAAHNVHEGDLYWDENDNIAGGNKLSSEEKRKAVTGEKSPAVDDVESSTATEHSDKIAPTKSTRKSKIPKLAKSPSPPVVMPREEEISKVSTTKNKGGLKSSQSRKKAEARSRIEIAKQEFKKKQAENEANGSSSMAFIPMDDLEPTGGDEILPPTGGDELLPPIGGGDEDLPPDINDDDSVATTTVDEDEYSPRRSSSFPGQGSRTDTIRALREITLQREHMEKALAELRRSSDEKFSNVQKQLTDFQSRGEFERDPDEYGRDARYNGLLSKSSNFSPTSLNVTNGRIGSPQDARETISRVLQIGDADDIGLMLDKFQPEYTEVLPLATLSRLFECISTLLRRGKFKDSCLDWTVALLNTSRGENLVQNLPDYTCKALVGALMNVSLEPNNRGVLAARLEAQLMDQCLT